MYALMCVDGCRAKRKDHQTPDGAIDYRAVCVWERQFRECGRERERERAPEGSFKTVMKTNKNVIMIIPP